LQLQEASAEESGTGVTPLNAVGSKKRRGNAGKHVLINSLTKEDYSFYYEASVWE
jgi:hypothetical protein